MAVLRCAQLLNKPDMYRLQIFLWDYPFLSRLYKLLPVNKRLRNLGWIQFISKSSPMYTSPFEPQAPDHLEKLAEILLFNFHREHILLKFKIKKLWRKFISKNFTAGVYQFSCVRCFGNILLFFCSDILTGLKDRGPWKMDVFFIVCICRSKRLNFSD